MDLFNDKWSEWYVMHTSGRGRRIKIKPTSSTVFGGAGSVSQMVNPKPNEYETSRIDNLTVIRFSRKFARRKKGLLNHAFTLEEYKEWKVKKDNGPDQTQLEEFL